MLPATARKSGIDGILALWQAGGTQQDLWDALFLLADGYDYLFGFKLRWWFPDGSKAIGIVSVNGIGVSLYNTEGQPVDKLAFRSDIACSDKVYADGKYTRPQA